MKHPVGNGRDEKPGLTRRRLLECAPWAGTGVVWGLAGGVPYALGLLGEAAAQPAGGLSFVQISDSHIGFAKPLNPDVKGTLGETVARVAAQLSDHDRLAMAVYIKSLAPIASAPAKAPAAKE